LNSPDGISGLGGYRTAELGPNLKNKNVYYYFNGCSFTWGDELEDPDRESYAHKLMEMLHIELQGKHPDCVIRSNLINEAMRGGSNDRIVRTSTQTLFSPRVNVKHFRPDQMPKQELARWAEPGNTWPPLVAIIQWTYPMRFEVWNADRERFAAIAPQSLMALNSDRDKNAMGRFTDQYMERACRAMLDSECFNLDFQMQQMFTQMVQLRAVYKSMDIPYLFIAFQDERVSSRIEKYKRVCYNHAQRHALEMYYELSDDPWCLMSESDGMANLLDRPGCALRPGGHPNAEMHKLYAKFLFNKMNDNGIIQKIKQRAI
jgi:hypothetical protein